MVMEDLDQPINMQQITGFIKAFNESCIESTGMVYNYIDSSMCLTPVEWKKKDIYWGHLRSKDFFLIFRFDYEDDIFIGGSVNFDHLKNEVKVLDPEVNHPCGICIYKLDEEICQEIKDLNLQPINKKNERNTGLQR